MCKKDEDKSNKNNRTHGFKIRYVIFVVLGVVLVSIIGAIVINELYKVGNGYYTEWEASDVLMFFAAILGAIGTVGLGGLTLWQNEKLREQNERLSQANDVNQEKLNQLTKDANAIASKSNELYLSSNELLFKSNELLLKSNEQNIIDKIIENLNKHLNKIIIDFQEFINICEPVDIVQKVESNPMGLKGAVLVEKRRLQHAFSRLENEINASLLSYNSKQQLKEKVCAARSNTNNYLEYLLNMDPKDSEEFDSKKMAESLLSANKAKDRYINDVNTAIVNMLKEDLTLSKIREMLSENGGENNAGQDEDAE